MFCAGLLCESQPLKIFAVLTFLILGLSFTASGKRKKAGFLLTFFHFVESEGFEPSSS